MEKLSSHRRQVIKVSKRYWRRRDRNAGWSPAGWLPLLGLVVVFGYAIQSSSSTAAQSSQQLRILKSASHGEKDDLKRISGVGPKLEGLLNDNGIYYFWQVAAWSAADMEKHRMSAWTSLEAGFLGIVG